MLRSAAYATEGCVHVRIAGLEPVAERAAHHAPGRTRRAALHHVVLAVKEVGRIAGIEGKRSEAWKRLKGRRRPFPAVAQQALNTARTPPGRMGVDRSGIPTLEIKVPMGRFGRRVTPREGRLDAG